MHAPRWLRSREGDSTLRPAFFWIDGHGAAAIGPGKGSAPHSRVRSLPLLRQEALWIKG
jgi:hypothetical protein